MDWVAGPNPAAAATVPPAAPTVPTDNPA